MDHFVASLIFPGCLSYCKYTCYSTCVCLSAVNLSFILGIVLVKNLENVVVSR